MRFILLLTGIVIIAAILWDAHRRRHPTHNLSREPSPDDLNRDLDEEMIIRASRPAHPNFFSDSAAQISTLARPQTPVVDPLELPEVIIINVMARSGQQFKGDDLLIAFESLELHFGQHKIFHRNDNYGSYQNELFSVASALEPGIFDLPNMHSYTTPGLTLFMSLTTEHVSTGTFELLLRTARHLAIKLKGELRDQQHRDLTIQAIELMREQVRLKAQQLHSLAAMKI